MRPFTLLSLLLAASLALPCCSQKTEPDPDRIDPAELEATKERLSKIGDQVRAASRRAGEISRKARDKGDAGTGRGDAGTAPAPAR